MKHNWAIEKTSECYCDKIKCYYNKINCDCPRFIYYYCVTCNNKGVRYKSSKGITGEIRVYYNFTC